MKFWKKCANEQISKTLGKIECPEDRKMAHEFNERWREFAKTGACDYIPCRCCPFYNHRLCNAGKNIGKIKKERIAELNREVEDILDDRFDSWFSKTFPNYTCADVFLEPYYSIAETAYDKGFEDGAKGGSEC